MRNARDFLGRMGKWRFIDDGAATATVNMARDEALASGVGKGGNPALRIYRFAPPAVSLGRFQRIGGFIDVERCRGMGVGLVRRPTGGMAILHMDDVTYSVTIPRIEGDRDDRGKYFTVVAEGVMSALEILGVESELVAHHAADARGGDWCFEGAFGVDLEWADRKICGSAQKVFKKSVLQHGSLFLKFHPEILHEISAKEENRSGRGGSEPPPLVTVSEAAGRAVSSEEVGRAFTEGFGEGLGMEIEPGGLSREEESAARNLLISKYDTEEWLLRGVNSSGAKCL